MLVSSVCNQIMAALKSSSQNRILECIVQTVHHLDETQLRLWTLSRVVASRLLPWYPCSQTQQSRSWS